MVKKSFSDKSIGNFVLGKTIGQGTFGKVKQAVHLPTGEKVAIKILEKHKIKDKKDLLRVRRQLSILKQVNHPNIVKLHQIIQKEDKIYIVTELVIGQELYGQIVKKGQLNLNDACVYFTQLLHAVIYLHDQGVCHRDIKPENIIVSQNKLKLLDFGLSSKFSQNNYKMTTPCGSLCYAAPQMLKEKKYDCRKVDVWAIGVTLYAMLFGKLPFEHQNTQKLYKKIQKQELSDNLGLPSEVNKLLKGMIQKNPEKRITLQQISANIWINDLFKNTQISRQTSRLNTDLVDTVGKIYQVQRENLIRKIYSNQKSEMVTHYRLLVQKKLFLEEEAIFRKQRQNSFIHSEPFQIQFVYKSLQKLINALQLSGESFNIVEKEPTKIIIQMRNSQFKVKSLKNAPKMFYFPMQLTN